MPYYTPNSVRFIYSCETCLVKEKNFSSYVLHTCLYIKLERYKTEMRPFIDLLRAIAKHIKKNLKSAQTYRKKVGCENGNTSLTCTAIKLENLKGILPKKFFDKFVFIKMW